MFKKKYPKIIVIFIILAIGFVFYFFPKDEKLKNFDFENKKKSITLIDEGIHYQMETSDCETVENFLEEQKIKINSDDFIFPSKDKIIHSGSKIIIERSKNFTLSVDGKKIEGKTLGNRVAMAIWDSKVKMGEDDLVSPLLDSPIKNGAKIEITRVEIKEEIVKKEVDFEKKYQEDEKLSWRTKKIEQKGVKGTDELKYRVVSHNGKEISRKLLEKNRTKDPIPEIAVQGTYMKLGKAKKGQGTWYAWKGGLFAASLTIPRGGFAKVTNLENGKSVVVQINDAGPYGAGRIIDLDKVAFEKIADLGTGVIGVKVEQVLN